MYHVEYLFDLDVADKAHKELFESVGHPFPVLKNAIRNTLTYNAPRMLTQEEQKHFIEVCCEEFKNTDLDRFVVTGAHYVGIKEAYFVPDEGEPAEQDNLSSATKNSIRVRPRRV